ncbi:Tex family protein [Parachlamydia sp. AcF125]|uniref:Tex family protein n=1 Tax=Parachlamydia sp. AcF125 TaxID=2795736 RepID=UPI001BC90D08|nr:Tex family protein [Parachlamydia sp. AcF125]MBS4168431.1 Protein YhgF [Parachlamydia sp. AcF125]
MLQYIFDPITQLTQELQIPARHIAAVIELLQAGNTVPFIARYRKEATGNLDEVQIRDIQERYHYLKELEERKQSILQSISEQGKLTDTLKAQILACQTKNGLEDLYLPYKPKRRTRASIAREKGLEPLAEKILAQPIGEEALQFATSFINSEKGVETAEDAFQGAQDIVAEQIAETATIRALVREEFATKGVLVCQVVEGKDQTATKYEQYYQYQEKIANIPSHRYLAIRRGEREGILDFYLEVEAAPLLGEIGRLARLNPASSYHPYLQAAIADGYKRLLVPSVETDLRVELKVKSDRDAVHIFAENLRNLLLSAPLGEHCVLGIDPGMRTGCKCATIDATGKFLGNMTIYPFTGDSEKAARDFMAFVDKYTPFAIAIGNGTGGRETETFVRKVLSDYNKHSILVVSISEAGASVYSASDVAREEFPDLDLTVRGAISIARRLQDPLAELVKIDPKAIGVGQYQHDVYQQLLHDQLSQVVESCVNHVGVELNTASASLLSYVSGIGASVAAKIVKYREQFGAFKKRQQLLSVPGVGPRTFEQAAGFLRIRGGEHPLDASAVHPERYSLVEQMAQDLQTPLHALCANGNLVKQIDLNRYVTDQVGLPTLRDILEELKKPGRDPRATFDSVKFREDVLTLKDLKEKMQLEGIVTNVTAFGAFVDIGVHQDGLIHISELSDQFVKDPSEVVKTGDRIKVTVLSVDIERKRIALSARSQGGSSSKPPLNKGKEPTKQALKPASKKFSNNPFANL